jgi:hypothetical protein
VCNIITHHKNNIASIILLGYTSIKLKERLECQFKCGMSWENYGTKWHIDHKKPITLFTDQTNIRLINSLSNLQPMLKEENWSKGNRHTR